MQACYIFNYFGTTDKTLNVILSLKAGSPFDEIEDIEEVIDRSHGRKA